MSFKVVCNMTSAESIDKYLVAAGIQVIRAPMFTEDEIIKNGHDANAVIVGAVEQYTRKAISGLEKCKVISRAGIGCDNIELQAATDTGIVVSYVPDASTEEVSNHALAFILDFARKVTQIDRAVRQGEWQPGKKTINNIRIHINRLSEQTLGLVGLGRIGGAVCMKAKAFGMHVLVYDPYVPSYFINLVGGKKANLDEVVSQSDFISLHLPLSENTRHLINAELIGRMKKTAFLINTARGALLDEAALYQALSNGSISGAGIDVTDPEPPVAENPLLKLENVIVTAHTAFYSQASVVELGKSAAEAVIAVAGGKWPKDVANPSVRSAENCRLK